MTVLQEIFTLIVLENDVFQAAFIRPRTSLDGGQVAAQAVFAACHTVPEGFFVHSAHVTFLAAGDSMKPVQFKVFRDRTGKTFATRHVQVFQDNRLIVRVTASFTLGEEGLDVQRAQMPEVVQPFDASPFDPSVLGFTTHDAMPEGEKERAYPTSAWVKTQDPIGNDGHLHACALLYFSDMCNAMPDLVDDPSLHFQTSLDHAVWFHRAVNTDEWVLMHLEGVSLAAGRAWFQGQFFDQQGVLLATSTQELLFRQMR